MIFFYLSIFLSLLIGILIISWIRSFDIYEKETYNAMLIAFLVGGVVSVLFSVILYRLIEGIGVSNSYISSPAGAFLIIGPVEEFSKLAGLVLIFAMMKRQFNEITDGVIYISCVALGFSLIENFFYANAGDNNGHLLFVRVLVSTPAHISVSCIMGYAWYRYRIENKSIMTLLTAFAVSSVLHGIYDTLAFTPLFTILIFPFLALIIQQCLRIIQYTNIQSPFRPVFEDLFINEEGITATELKCPFCGSTEPRSFFSNTYFVAFRCDHCGYHFTKVKDMKTIFRVFAPEYKRFTRKLMPEKEKDNRIRMTVYNSAFLTDDREWAFFNVAVVGERIKSINERILGRFRKSSMIPDSILEKIID